MEQPDNIYHVTSNNRIIIDKDTTNWVDFLAGLDAMVKHGEQQELHVSFLDKTCNEYVQIASDAALLEAFSQYWEIRKLPLQVIVHDLVPPKEELCSANLETALVAVHDLEGSIGSCNWDRWTQLDVPCSLWCIWK